MSIAFRSILGANAGASNDLTVTAPAGLQDDDFILIAITTISISTILEPAGWTQIGTTQDQTTDSSVALFYKIASSEPASWTFTGIFGSSVASRWASSAYSGVDTTTPLDAVSTQNASGFTTTPATTTITPSNSGSMVIAVHGMDSSGTPTGTPSAGWTERIDVATRPSVYQLDQLLGAPSAVISAPTMTASDFYGNFALALKEASGGESIELSGEVPGLGQPTVSLTSASNISGSILGLGQPAGLLEISANLTGSVPGLGQPSGFLDISVNLSGSINGLGQATASIEVQNKLSGEVIGIGQATGTLSIDDGITLSGEVVGLGQAVGSLEVITDIELSGVVEGLGQAVGILTIESDTSEVANITMILSKNNIGMHLGKSDISMDLSKNNIHMEMKK